jgi:hypothetical protein
MLDQGTKGVPEVSNFQLRDIADWREDGIPTARTSDLQLMLAKEEDNCWLSESKYQLWFVAEDKFDMFALKRSVGHGGSDYLIL